MSRQTGQQQQQYPTVASIITPSEAALQIGRSKIDHVQLDALTVLKLVKHCQELSNGTDVAQGILTGMVQGEEHGPKRIEITNCFPLPSPNTVKVAEYDEFCNTYTQENLKTFRHLNIDYLIIGWYQSSSLNTFLNRDFIESQFMYQSDVDESVAIIYDPFKIQQGSLYLKAYRLTPEAMALYKKKELTNDAFKEAHLNYDNFVEELPVVIRNSHLVNSMLLELEEMAPSEKKYGFLDLATNNILEKSMRSLIDSVDIVCQESTKYLNYHKQLQKQNHAKQLHIQKREAENTARKGRGEPPLPDEDLNKIFKPLNQPSRLETLLVSNQIKNHCQQLNDFTAQSFSRLFIADALQNK